MRTFRNDAYSGGDCGDGCGSGCTSGCCAQSAPAAGDASSSAAPPAAPPTAPAPPPTANDGYPRIGGHVGAAIPIVTLAKQSTAIGADFVTLGVTPGVTVHLDENWMIDFEFIAFNEVKNTPAATTFIVDPGLLRKLGPVVAGVRVATQVGAPTNIGVVPIVVVPVVKVTDKVSYFVEADVPLFLRDNGTSLQPSATLLLQTGFGF